MTACRPIGGRPVRAIYTFETVSSTEWADPTVNGGFRPNRYVDVSATRDRKQEALGHYAREMRAFPHARSLENVDALGRYRGASAGVAFAEAFVTVREIV